MSRVLALTHLHTGPEDWLELWQLELECIKDIKNRAKRRDHEAEARTSDDAGLGAVDCSLGAAGRHVRRCGVCNVELSSVGPLEGMVTWGGRGIGGGGGRYHSSCINLALHRCSALLMDPVQQS